MLGFNPYRVFSGSATSDRSSHGVVPNMFQSLSGFLGLCNRARRVSSPSKRQFQSLSGFLGLCNLTLNDLLPLVYHVSIPIGFSRALQPWPWSSCDSISGSFNPYRVFSGSATHVMSPLDSQLHGMFQSLSGFLGLCNGRAGLGHRDQR